MKIVLRIALILFCNMLTCAFVSTSTMYTEPVYIPEFKVRHLNDFRLKGNVKKVYERQCEAYPAGTEITLRFAYAYTFNNDGILTENNRTQGIGEGTRYAYTFKGKNLTQVIQYNRSYKDSALEKWDFNYNKDSLLTDVKFYMKGYNWDLMTVYTYEHNKSRQIISETVTGRKGAFEEKTTYEYDKKGNVISFTEYKEMNKPYYTKKYKFDNNGQILSTNMVYTSGSVYTTEFKYDGNGNRIEAKSNSVYKGVPESEQVLWKYVFDSKGNWTEKNETINGLKTKRVTRVIEYF